MLFNIQKAFLAVSCRQSRLPQPFSILIGQEMPPGYRNKAATVAKSHISHNHKCPWLSCAVRRALFNHIKNTVNTSHCSSQLVNPTPKPQYSGLNIFPFYMRAKSGWLSIEDNHTAFTLGAVRSAVLCFSAPSCRNCQKTNGRESTEGGQSTWLKACRRVDFSFPAVKEPP